MSLFQSICRCFQVNVHIFENMSTLWNICHFCLINIQCLYFGTSLCLAQVMEENLQIRRLVKKKHRGRNKIRKINNRFVMRPIVCSKCQKDEHNRRICNANPIPDLDKAKISFSNILSTLVWFFLLFWHCVHIFRYMSHFGIFVHT